MKKLLILNGSLSEVPLIKKAKELGYYVITSGNDPSLIGHAYSDEYIPADYSNMDKILQLVKEHNIERIVSCANDFGVITASYVSDRMGFPGHDTYENAKTLHQKDLFKALIQEMGISCPFSTTFSTPTDAIQFAENAEYPVIVKATDLTGGKGILRADDVDEAIIAIENAFSASRKKQIVIEPFIAGIQQSIDTFVIDKKVVSSISNDVYCPINPYLIQSETLPAVGIENIQDKLHKIIESISERLNLVDGMFTLQYIIKDGEPYIIEMMRRCLGNQFLTVAGAVTGFPWEEALIRSETGMSLDNLVYTKPLSKFAGHHGVMATRNGTVAGYTIDPEVEKHLFQKIDIIKPGEQIRNYLNERIAYIYYTYDNQQEMINTVRHMNELIKIDFLD